MNPSAKAKAGNDLQQPEILVAHRVAQSNPKTDPEAIATYPDLAAVVAAWPKLAKATRKQIVKLAMGGK